MANAVWPPGLPQIQRIGLTDRRRLSAIITPVDAGPVQMRQRFTNVSRDVDIPLELNNVQRQIFDPFFVTTIAGGTLPFDWEDPVDDSVVSFRFRNAEFPQFTLSVNATGRIWVCTMALELLPGSPT